MPFVSCELLAEGASLRGPSKGRIGGATTQHGEPAKHEIDVLINKDDALSAAKAMPKLSASRETLDFRRSADFYAWHGSCYTQDRHQNWYEIDGRLC
jgi:hypothetical protein